MKENDVDVACSMRAWE